MVRGLKGLDQHDRLRIWGHISFQHKYLGDAKHVQEMFLFSQTITLIALSVDDSPILLHTCWICLLGF